MDKAAISAALGVVMPLFDGSARVEHSDAGPLEDVPRYPPIDGVRDRAHEVGARNTPATTMGPRPGFRHVFVFWCLNKSIEGLVVLLSSVVYVMGSYAGVYVGKTVLDRRSMTGLGGRLQEHLWCLFNPHVGPVAARATNC